MSNNNLNRERRVALGAALLCALVVVASPPGLAQPLADVDGVVEVGTIDPWSSSDGASSYAPSGDGSSSGSSDSSSCLIPNPFGGCIFQFEEHDEFQHLDQGEETWYWYESANSSMSGYYVDILGGIVYARAGAGALDEASGSGSTGDFHRYDRTYYDNNIGYSEEHVDDWQLVWDDAEASYRRVDQTFVEAGADAPVAHADVGADRQANGAEGASASSEGRGSNSTSDEFFGIPAYAEEDDQSHALASQSERFWNRTALGGTIYLVNPTDGSRVDVVGITMDRATESGSGESEHESASREATSVFGFTVFEHESSDAGQSEYAFFREWLHLSVDLVSGQVSGDIAYDHGDESSAGSSDTADNTEIVGVPVYGEEHSTSEEAQSEWRDVSFAIDAAQGLGVLHVDAWDDSSRSHETYEDTYSIVGIPAGLAGESDSSFHSDGVGFGLDVAGGVLWIGASYENTTSGSSSFDDFTLDRNPLVGVGSEDRESSRGIWAGAGSALLPVSAGAHHENSSSHSGDWLRLGGEEFAGITSDDEHTEYGGDANAAGVFVFSFLYEDGRSDDAIHLAGIPLGVRDDYKRLDVGASGDVVAPTGQNVFSYSFEHEESSDDYDLYADDTTIGGARHNVTNDRVNIIVLDGVLGAHASREFSNTQVIAGEDTEIAEVGIQQIDAGVEHGGASDAGVDEGGADASVFLSYIEAADAIAIIVGLATWCVDPGVPIPYDAVLGAMPPEVQPVAATAIAAGALLLCFGAPVVAPIFLASPCIVVPLALGTVFLAGGTATSLLPAGSDVAGAVLGTAEGAVWQGYDDVLGCVWLTIPDAARNPQPAIAALGAATEASDGVLAQVWPAYDGGRTTAWGVIDMALGAEGALPAPEGIPAPPNAPELPPEAPVPPSELPPAPV